MEKAVLWPLILQPSNADNCMLWATPRNNSEVILVRTLANPRRIAKSPRSSPDFCRGIGFSTTQGIVAST